MIVELKHLWEVGVQAYDIFLKNNFQMHAALLWTISDFPAYSMFSGWSRAGKFVGPHCFDDTESFRLPFNGKLSWFNNHRRFLPVVNLFFWKKNAITENKVITEGPLWDKRPRIIRKKRLRIKKVIEMTLEETRMRLQKWQRTYES